MRWKGVEQTSLHRYEDPERMIYGAVNHARDETTRQKENICMI